MPEIYSDRMSPKTIEQYYAAAEGSIDRLRIKEDEYSEDSTGYDSKMDYLRRVKTRIAQSNKADAAMNANERHSTKDRLETAERGKMLASLLESVISREFDSNDWLETLEVDSSGNSMSEITLASEYDDIINGADLVGIARGADLGLGTKPTVFAIDVSYGHGFDAMRQKMNRVNRAALGHGGIPRFTRLDFCRTEYTNDGEEPIPLELDDVPRFVVGAEVNGDDFFHIMRQEFGDKKSPHYNATEVRAKANKALERLQYKVVAELAEQANGTVMWLRERVNQDDGLSPELTKHLQTSLSNMEPLVGYFDSALERVKAKYPHLNTSALKNSDRVFSNVMEYAEDVREGDDPKAREILRRRGASIPYESACRMA
jgi:hypothetical protein